MKRQAKQGEILTYTGKEMKMVFSSASLRPGDVVRVRKGGWYPTVNFSGGNPYVPARDLEPAPFVARA